MIRFLTLLLVLVQCLITLQQLEPYTRPRKNILSTFIQPREECFYQAITLNDLIFIAAQRSLIHRIKTTTSTTPQTTSPLTESTTQIMETTPNKNMSAETSTEMTNKTSTEKTNETTTEMTNETTTQMNNEKTTQTTTETTTETTTTEITTKSGGRRGCAGCMKYIHSTITPRQTTSTTPMGTTTTTQETEEEEFEDPFVKEASQALSNLVVAAYEADQASPLQIVKTTNYLKDINNANKLAQAYKKYFYVFPLQTTIEVSNLPGHANITIDGIGLGRRHD